MRPHDVIRRAGAGLVLLTLAAVLPAQAAVHSCVINGVKTYTDSPSRCPSKADPNRPSPPLKAAEPVPARRVPSAAPSPTVNEGSRTSPAPTAPVASTQAIPPECSAVGTQDPTKLQECLVRARRAEVRRIAQGRLAALRSGMSEFLSTPSRIDGEIAMTNDGRPVEWCRNALTDVLASQQVDVVDDETAAMPTWIGASAGGGAGTAAPVLDPAFQAQAVGGSSVVSGYVSLRWRAQPIVVRLVFACVRVGDGAADGLVCNPQRYTSLYVYDQTTPIACHVGFVGRPYWANWSASMTPLRLRQSTSQGSR